VTNDVNILVIIIAKDDNSIAAVQFEIKLFDYSLHTCTQLIVFYLYEHIL